MFPKKLKLSIYFIVAIFLALGVSVSLQSVSAALFETVGKGAQIGNSGLQLLDVRENLIYGVINAGGAQGSLILLQTGSDNNKFRVDYAGNVTAAGNITVAGQNVCRQDGTNCKAGSTDATTLSGIDISRIVYGSNQYKTASLGTSISPQAGSGFYESSNAADGPIGANWAHYLIVNHSNSGAPNGYQMIIAQPYWEDNLYTRRVDSDVKRSWRKILDSGNYNSYTFSANAANVSAGAFGLLAGNGPYGFPEKISIGYGAGTTPLTLGQSATLSVNGNVGIGTAAPNNLIQVAGLINFNNTLFSTFLGYRAGFSNTTGDFNTANGVDSLYSNTTGYDNTANGVNSLYSNTTGIGNTAIGMNSGRFIANGVTANQTSDNSVYLGYGTRALADGDTNEIVIGSGAVGNGSNSVTLGGAVTTKTILRGNVGIGMAVPNNLIQVAGLINFNNTLLSTSLGYQAGSVNTGNSNTFVGYQAGSSNTAGGGNTANGKEALFSNTGGSQNTANGYAALYTNAYGSQNTANGMYALSANTAGSQNTANGMYALSSNNTGNSNTAIGYNTGVGISTGSNNTIIGANVTVTAPGPSNNIIIADGAGNQRINVGSTGNVGIGTAAPNSKLTVAGTIELTSGGGIKFSDASVQTTAYAGVTALAGTWWGTNYFGSNKGAGSYVGGQNTYGLEAYSSDLGAAGMSFHRGGYYAVNMGLDPDNVLRIGGWSAPANRWQLDMSGNETLAGNLNAVNGNFSGTVTAGSFSGPLSGTINAANVSSGIFGSYTTGGNYFFPASLDVVGGLLVNSANASYQVKIGQDRFGSAANIRVTPNLHLNSPGGSIYLNWDGGGTPAVIFGNAAGAEMSRINTSGQFTGSAAAITGYNNPATAGTANTIAYRDGSGGLTATTFIGTVSNLAYFSVASGVNPDTKGTTGINYFIGGATSPYGDGALYQQAHQPAPTTWGSQIMQDYRTGRLAVRGLSSAAWTGWLNLIDSGNIGSQTVATAGNLSGHSAGYAYADGGTATLANGVNQFPNRTDNAWYQVNWNNAATGDKNLYSSAKILLRSSGYGAIGWNGNAWYIEGNPTYGLYSNTGLYANGGLWDAGNRVYSAGNPQVNISGSAGSAGILTGSAHTNGSDGWFRSANQAGWYSDTYGVGVYATVAGRVDLYNNAGLYVPGNVGIGTTNPLAQLSVGSGSFADASVPVQISAPASGTSWYGANKNGAYGLLMGYVTNSGLSGNGAYIRQVTSDPLYFNVNNTTNAMTILSSGNVGIGTTDPSGGGIISSKFTIKNDSSTSFALLGTSNAKIFAINPESNSGATFYNGAGGSWAAAMTLLNGSVGIGTAAPRGNLDVYGSELVVGSPSNPYNEIQFFDSTASSGTNRIRSTAGDLAFFTSNTQRLTIQNTTGNVGIGTISNYKLDVQGDVVARGQVYSSSYGWLSDERLKQNIKPIASPIETLMQINGKSFDWRKAEFPDKNFPDGIQYGMIAQDVEKVLPSVVTTMKDGFETINYAAFTPFLIEAIKQQQTQIENISGLGTGNGIIIQGNVGIGTAAPAARLDLGQLPASIEGLRIKIGATTPYSPFVIINADGTDAFRVDQNGDVNAVNNTITAGSFVYSSDKTLNKDIKAISNALDKVLQLNGVMFNWKADGRPDLGLIAQDVEKVFPDLVQTDEITNLKSVEYGNLVAPIIEAIKEQQKQLEEQKNQNLELQRQINDLRKQK